MKEYIYIGKIVNTHGIKGELRILSDFFEKEKIFKPNVPIYIGQNKQKEIITTYRKHKQFDMISLDGYDNINAVLKYKNQNVYIDRSMLDLKENEYLLSDLIGMEVLENEKVLGKIMEIVYNKANILLYIKGNKNFYIPYMPEYIKEVNVKQKKVFVEGGSQFIL